jgi:hypothetical protein
MDKFIGEGEGEEVIEEEPDIRSFSSIIVPLFSWWVLSCFTPRKLPTEYFSR